MNETSRGRPARLLFLLDLPRGNSPRDLLSFFFLTVGTGARDLAPRSSPYCYRAVYVLSANRRRLAETRVYQQHVDGCFKRGLSLAYFSRSISGRVEECAFFFLASRRRLSEILRNFFSALGREEGV